jgi:hypothetical protein
MKEEPEYNFNIFDHGSDKAVFQSLGYIGGSAILALLTLNFGLGIYVPTFALGLLKLGIVGYTFGVFFQTIANTLDSIGTSGLPETVVSIRGVLSGAILTIMGGLLKYYILNGVDNVEDLIFSFCSTILTVNSYELICLNKTRFGASMAYLKLGILASAFAAFYIYKMDALGYAICLIGTISGVESFCVRIVTPRGKWCKFVTWRVVLGCIFVLFAYFLLHNPELFYMKRIHEIQANDNLAYAAKTGILSRIWNGFVETVKTVPRWIYRHVVSELEKFRGTRK